MIDYLVRAESLTAWQTYAQSEGWLVETGEDGTLVPASGVLIDEIGPVVIVPAVIENGEVTTEAVVDPWHHVNLRLLDPPEAVVTKMSQGKAVITQPKGIDAVEVGVEPMRVQVLSAGDIATPIRVWADGMHFSQQPIVTPQSAT